MSEWREIELGSIAEYRKDRIDAKYLTVSNYISTENMLSDRQGITTSSYVPTKGKTSKYSSGNILVSNIRPYFKKIWFANKNGGCSNDVIVFEANEELIDSRFLYYQLSKDEFFDFVMSGSNGTKMPRGNKNSIPLFRFLLPDLSVQKHIASILSTYDDLLENNIKRIRLLEELAQRTYEEWFVKFRINGKQLEVCENGLPAGWFTIPLVEVADLVMGQSPKSEFYNKERIGTPFHQGVSDYGFRFPENKSWSSHGTRYAEPGDILFSVRAPVGRLNVAKEKIILGRGLSAIRHTNGYTNGLFYQLQNIFFQDDLMGGGAIFNSVTKNDVQRIPILVADLSTTKKYNTIAQNIDLQILNLTTQNLALKDSRDILLPRLMSGEIDVEKEVLGMVAEENSQYQNL